MATGIEVGFGAGSIFGVGVGVAEIIGYASVSAEATREAVKASPVHPRRAIIAIRTVNFISPILTKKLPATNCAVNPGHIGISGLFGKLILL